MTYEHHESHEMAHLTKNTKKKTRVSCFRVFVGLCIAAVSVGASAIHPQSAIRDPQSPPRLPDVHFAATPMPVADAMLKLARVSSSDVVYDLGSGDGRIVILAAQKYGARGVGIEIDPRLVELSRTVARDGEVTGRVTFIEGDLFAADISAATVVTLWLTASVNARLTPKLLRELRPGTRIVAHQFPLGQWTPEQTIRVDGEEIFLWTVPPR
jgi:SAM-dependent methyltransferase